METLLLQVILRALLAIAIYRFLSRRNKSILQEPPEPSGKLPIIGHLLQLGGKQTLSRTLGTMEDSQGPIFTIWRGQRRAMVTLVVAGSDTTYITMTWLLTLLLNHPHVLKKAQEELDNVVGNSRNLDESNIPNLPYPQAIVKETLRLFPAGPLSVPHKAIEACNIGGFEVPAGTQIMSNLWKIQRDPSVWENPSEFRPERFLTTHKDVDLKGQHFDLIPFGSGRKMCPGMTFALQVVHLTTARLLQGFDMVTPRNEPLDMSEGLGLTMPKTTPLDVVITPRLSSNLYHF